MAVTAVTSHCKIAPNKVLGLLMSIVNSVSLRIANDLPYCLLQMLITNAKHFFQSLNCSYHFISYHRLVLTRGLPALLSLKNENCHMKFLALSL